ncbi:MAG: glycosyl transferase family 25 [Candidatus Endobugula sp.]|jgi:glycosyl transferase family 25
MIDIYLINVRTATERREFQENQLKQLDLGYTLIEAVTTDDISDDLYQKHYYDWQRPMRVTEVACYYSHRKVWEIIKQKQRPALILEDDVLLSKETPSILKKIEQVFLPNMELIVLENRNRKKWVQKHKEAMDDKNALVQLVQDRTGAAAYILWPNGAQKILEHAEKSGISLADAHIFSCPDLKKYQLEPAAAVQLDCCGAYGIERNTQQHSASVSSVGAQKKPPREPIFYFKRATAQLWLGIQAAYFSCLYEKRNIAINREDFT